MLVLLFDAVPLVDTTVAAAAAADDDDDDDVDGAAAAAVCGTTVFIYLRLSLWDLYSIGVFGGRFNTRRNVSRIRVVQL